MGERLPWFTCYPSKLLGALAAMSPDQQLVYQIVLLRIYEVGGPCRDTADAMARRTQLTKRRVEVALAALFDAKKLFRDGDGIMNPFAAEVMAENKAFHEKRVRAGKNGGLRSAEKRSKNQRKGPSKAGVELQQSSTHIQKHIQEQTPQEATPPSESSRARKPTKTPFPDGWIGLGQTGIDYAKQHGFGIERAQEMFEHFRDHHTSRGNRMVGSKGWEAAWRTWVRNQVEFDKRDKRRGGRDGERSGSIIDAWDGLSRAVEGAEDRGERQGSLLGLPPRSVR